MALESKLWSWSLGTPSVMLTLLLRASGNRRSWAPLRASLPPVVGPRAADHWYTAMPHSGASLATMLMNRCISRDDSPPARGCRCRGRPRRWRPPSTWRATPSRRVADRVVAADDDREGAGRGEVVHGL